MEEFVKKLTNELKKIPTEYRHEEYNKAIRDVVRFINRLAEECKISLMKELLEAKRSCGEDSDCSDCPFGQIEDRCILQELQIEKENNGWIPCSDKLPEEPNEKLDEQHEIERAILFGIVKEYMVTIEGADMPTTLYYIGDGFWYDNAAQDSCYRVVAWKTLPPAYQPKGA